jgi:DeoR/GlpR family transcriptional regulator of sugar metabolism
MADQRMLTAEREHRIIELLHEATVLKVADLGQALGVSEATVRRDLQSMHERGLLQRVRGGATLHPLTRAEPMFDDKQTQNAAAKNRIAAAALELIDDYDQIYLDGGSTVLALARLLAHRRRHLTITTNSLMAAEALMNSGHRLVVIGGEFRPLSRTVVGPLTAATVEQIHVDKAFMGTIGFTVTEGLMTTDPNEAFTKELILHRANQVILLADGSKLGIPSFARSGRPQDIDVLVTERVDETFRGDAEDLGIQIIVAEG